MFTVDGIVVESKQKLFETWEKNGNKYTSPDSRVNITIYGNNIYIGSILPHSSQISLASMINGIGLATIFLTLVQSTISLHIFYTKGRERLSRFFDHVSFTAFLIGYAAVNLILPLVARS